MKRKIITVIIMSLLLATSVFNYRVYAARPTLQWIENENPYNLTDAEKQLAKSYATEIKNNSKITYSYGSTHISQYSGDGAFSRDNIYDTANGNAAKRSNYGNNHGGSVYLSPYLLKAIIDLTNKYGELGVTTISEIAGASHSASSYHYYGIAADFTKIGGTCNVDRGKEAYNYLVSLGYLIAPTYAGTLYEDGHYHLAVTGYNYKPTTYQITYNANDGDAVPNNQTKTQGVSLYLSTVIPTREHHTFLGYSTYLGGPIVYQPGDVYTADSGATLYANWTYNYGFQVIGVLDGTPTYSTAEYGTYDIYINDKLVAQNASDYWNEFPVGTTYEVVLHLDEHYWLDTVNSSSLSGAIQDHTPIYLGINTNLYPLDLNAFIDGQYKPMLGEDVTCDLYINGQLEDEGISDHYQYYKYGTSYEFKNFRTTGDMSLESIAKAEDYNNDSYKDRIGTIEGPTNVNVIMHSCYKNSDDYRDNISKVEVFNDHTYLYFDSKLSWYDANSICKLLGGHLVTLTSEEENSFVDNFTEHNIIWTGGLCNANREWKWINNEVFQYSNWDMNWGLAQPNNGDAPDNIEGCEEYIILNFNEFSKGKWHDDAGSHVWNFVCEIDSVANDFNSNESLINTPTEYNKEWIIDVLKNNIATVGESININGKPFTVNSDNGVKMLEDANVVTVYATANNTSADRHVQYPKSMRVYTIESNPLNQLVAHPNLDNILSYAGASIRVTGNKGIRIITSIPTSKKNQLINDGIDGYQVMEYGTLMCWASDLANDEEPTLYKDSNGTFKANHGAKGRAYSRESNIYTIYSEGGGTTKYTNTLVGNYTDQQCASDFAMRSYMILRPKGNKNADGDIVVYGGTLYRSISYVAYQNKNAFSAGSNNYEYIWSLIRAGYGNQYDNEYKGNK